MLFCDDLSVRCDSGDSRAVEFSYWLCTSWERYQAYVVVVVTTVCRFPCASRCWLTLVSALLRLLSLSLVLGVKLLKLLGCSNELGLSSDHGAKD